MQSMVGEYTAMIKDFFEARDILDSKSRVRIQNVHKDFLNNVFNKNMKFRKLNSFAMVLNGGSVELILVFLFFIVALLLHNEKISVGMVSIAFMYSNKFIEPLFEFNLNLGRLKSIRSIKTKILNIINCNSYSDKFKLDSVNTITLHKVKKKLSKNEIYYPEFIFKNFNKYLVQEKMGSAKVFCLRC